MNDLLGPEGPAHGCGFAGGVGRQAAGVSYGFCQVPAAVKRAALYRYTHSSVHEAIPFHSTATGMSHFYTNNAYECKLPRFIPLGIDAEKSDFGISF